jgi:hypothetical protein
MGIQGLMPFGMGRPHGMARRGLEDETAGHPHLAS